MLVLLLLLLLLLLLIIIIVIIIYYYYFIIIVIIIIEWRKVGSAFKILAGKPTGKRPLGRPRFRWEENVRIYFKK